LRNKDKKFKYPKPKFHYGWAYLFSIIFILSPVFIGIAFFKDSLSFLGVIVWLFFAVTISGNIILGLFSPFFYVKKYTKKGLVKNEMFERLDQITISFYKDNVHNEFFPAYFDGFIIDNPITQQLETNFSAKEKEDRLFFLFGFNSLNQKNKEEIKLELKKYKLKKKINNFN
jgi:hypothetical protein